VQMAMHIFPLKSCVIDLLELQTILGYAVRDHLSSLKFSHLVCSI